MVKRNHKWGCATNATLRYCQYCAATKSNAFIFNTSGCFLSQNKAQRWQLVKDLYQLQQERKKSHQQERYENMRRKFKQLLSLSKKDQIRYLKRKLIEKKTRKKHTRNNGSYVYHKRKINPENIPKYESKPLVFSKSTWHRKLRYYQSILKNQNIPNNSIKREKYAIRGYKDYQEPKIRYTYKQHANIPYRPAFCLQPLADVLTLNGKDVENYFTSKEIRFLSFNKWENSSEVKQYKEYSMLFISNPHCLEESLNYANLHCIGGSIVERILRGAGDTFSLYPRFEGHCNDSSKIFICNPNTINKGRCFCCKFNKSKEWSENGEISYKYYDGVNYGPSSEANLKRENSKLSRSAKKSCRKTYHDVNQFVRLYPF